MTQMVYEFLYLFKLNYSISRLQKSATQFNRKRPT